MTTGSSGTYAIPGLGTNIKGTWSYREWNGADGKYTAGPGSPVQWNNYTCYVDREEIRQAFYRFVCTLPGGGGSGSLYNEGADPYHKFPSEAASSVTANDINKALGRILAQAKGHSLQLGVELGQARQTVNLVVDTLGKLGRSALALRRGDFSTAARQLGATPRTSRLKAKDVSGRWLELQYGWLPLISSVHDASQAYAAITDGPRKMVFTSSCKRKTTYYYLGPGDGVNATQDFIDRRSYMFEQTEDLSIPRSLGLENPLSVAWELIPWSFVVDWFVPIGTYLENLNQIPKLKGRWLVSRKLSTASGYRWWWQGDYPYCGYHGGHRYHVLTHKVDKGRSGAYVSRGVLSSPLEVPKPKFVPLSGALNPRRIWNAIALAHQRFTS